MEIENIASATVVVKSTREIMKGAFELDPEDPDGDITEVERVCIEEYHASSK